MSDVVNNEGEIGRKIITPTIEEVDDVATRIYPQVSFNPDKAPEMLEKRHEELKSAAVLNPETLRDLELEAKKSLDKGDYALAIELGNKLFFLGFDEALEHHMNFAHLTYETLLNEDQTFKNDKLAIKVVEGGKTTKIDMLKNADALYAEGKKSRALDAYRRIVHITGYHGKYYPEAPQGPAKHSTEELRRTTNYVLMNIDPLAYFRKKDIAALK